MRFYELRRQQFLNELSFNADIQFITTSSIPRFRNGLSATDNDDEDRRRLSWAIADYVFVCFFLRFTAGESIDNLRDNFNEVIQAYEEYTKYVRVFEEDPDFPPLFFREIDEYERALQLIGLCFLLHRRDLLPRIATMLDGFYAGKDTLYEDLLAYELEGRYDVDEWYHDAPYRDLINAFYRDSDQESIVDLQRYLQNWYISLKDVPWHDSHLNMTNESCGAYFGYWAIEAAAAVYLLELDDASFRDHIVYPKDLVDFARQWDRDHTNASATDSHSAERARLRAEGGQPCPVAGYWETPAQANSRRYFVQDEILPVFSDAAYGATIWQWAENQEGE